MTNNGPAHHLRDLSASGPSPCDACRHGDRCKTQLHACEAFGMFLHGLSEVRWRTAPRVPTRERYQALLGEG